LYHNGRIPSKNNSNLTNKNSSKPATKNIFFFCAVAAAAPAQIRKVSVRHNKKNNIFTLLESN